MTKKIEIRIRRPLTWATWARFSLSVASFIFVPISLGVYIESDAMQWIGFLFAIVSMVALAFREDNETTFSTFVEAVMYCEHQAALLGMQSPLQALQVGVHIQRAAADELASRKAADCGNSP